MKSYLFFGDSILTKVVNLNNPDMKLFYSIPPREAVIAAHAKFERYSGNTWMYDERYGGLVTSTALTVTCGNMTAFL